MTAPDQVSTGGRREDERRALISAMTAVVAAVGYQGATIPAVVAQARLEADAFGRHFRDLGACFLAAWEEVNECFHRALTAAFEESGAWREGVRAAAREGIRLLDQRRHEARLLFVEVLVAGEAARARRDASIRALADLLDRARTELGVPVWRSTAEAVVGGIYHTIGARLRRDPGVPACEVVPELAYMAVVPYFGHEAAVEEMRLTR